MKKKILIFSAFYYPHSIGGAEIAVKEITDRISPQDVEFDMVVLRKYEDAFERIGNVNIHRVGFKWRRGSKSSKFFSPSKYLYIFWAYFKAISLHRKNRYDAIWSIMASYAGFSASFFKKKFPSVPFILTLQEGDPPEHIRKRVGILWPIFLKIFKRADVIQAISNFLAKWSKQNGYQGEPIVIPNGVDIDLFTKHIDPNLAQELRESLGYSQEDFILVTTSRLVKKNGIEDVISSLQHLPKNVKFLILGFGRDGEKLESLTRELKLEQRVKFLGFVPHAEMPKYLKASDVFIRPSLSEGLGNSFLEAMAAEIPVVATLVGGIPDFLTDRTTGIAVEPENPKDIAEKIKILINDRELRDRIVQNAKAMVIEKYDWDKIANRMKDEIFE